MGRQHASQLAMEYAEDLFDSIDGDELADAFAVFEQRLINLIVEEIDRHPSAALEHALKSITKTRTL